MKEDSIDAFISGNNLMIGVENLGELEKLINCVIDKEKELQTAVHKLKQFRLQITFSQEKVRHHLLEDHTE